MPTPSKTQFNFSTIPDPATLPAETRAKLLSMPWFNQMLDLHEAGVNVDSALMEKLATKPGAQGFRVHEFELEPGKKQRGLLDIATGEMVSPEKLTRPDFQPTLKTVNDPATGKPAGTVLQTSPSSAVPYADKSAPLMQDRYDAAPIFDDKFNVLGHVFRGPDGSIHTMRKGEDMSALIGALTGKPTAAPTAAPGVQTPTPAAPAAAPSAQKPAFQLQTAEDFYRVPIGAEFITPDGKRKTRLK